MDRFVQRFLLSRATFDSTPTYSLLGVKCCGRVLRVYDGDTVWLAVVYPGKKVYKYRVRLYGNDSAELHPRLSDADHEDVRIAAQNAKEYLEQLLAKSSYVKVEFFTYDKYGRPLVKLWLPGEELSINEQMILKGHAVEYYGGTQQKVVAAI